MLLDKRRPSCCRRQPKHGLSTRFHELFLSPEIISIGVYDPSISV
jgi:hypothetical protein